MAIFVRLSFQGILFRIKLSCRRRYHVGGFPVMTILSQLSFYGYTGFFAVAIFHGVLS
jgi:hypothetical protein